MPGRREVYPKPLGGAEREPQVFTNNCMFFKMYRVPALLVISEQSGFCINGKHAVFSILSLNTSDGLASLLVTTVFARELTWYKQLSLTGRHQWQISLDT